MRPRCGRGAELPGGGAELQSCRPGVTRRDRRSRDAADGYLESLVWACRRMRPAYRCARRCSDVLHFGSIVCVYILCSLVWFVVAWSRFVPAAARSGPSALYMASEQCLLSLRDSAACVRGPAAPSLAPAPARVATPTGVKPRERPVSLIILKLAKVTCV